MVCRSQNRNPKSLAGITTRIAAVLLLSISGFPSVSGAHPSPQQTSSQTASARPVGTIKAISGNSITLATDAGTEVLITVSDGTRLLRVEPGQTDLKSAVAIQFQDLQVSDRVLVRGNFAEDGKTVLATSVIVMKKADLAEKQAHDSEEWQRHGVGGLVNAIDVANGTITLATNALGANKTVIVHVVKNSVLIRYAPGSVKFSEAKSAPINEIKVGDQLRARGTRSPDGSELTADEIVSGSFQNIAGIVSAIDGGSNAITVSDLISKKPVTVAFTVDSQLRKIPPQMAQRIAMRLKGAPAEGAPAGQPIARPAESQAGGAPGGSRFGGGGGDIQQMIARMPAATIADLQKGDAVMIVATQGTSNQKTTAITLLSGVEAILAASPQGAPSTILSPWSLSGAPGGDAGPQQ